MNCHNSAKIICTLYKIRAQQQWIEKQVFAISSHIYQTVSQDYMLLHKIFVPQSFTKHSYPNITRTSAKASATSHVKNWLQKSIWAYTATIIIIISPIVDTKPKISTLSIRIIRITSHYLKYFESKSIFIDYYTIAPVFNSRSIIHGNTKWEKMSFQIIIIKLPAKFPK